MNQLEQMTSEIVDVFRRYDAQGTKTWTADIAAHDLQYQIGNLSKCILQLRGFRFAEGLDDTAIKNNAADELADIMAEVLFIAHELDINITKAWSDMIACDEKKIENRSN